MYLSLTVLNLFELDFKTYVANCFTGFIYVVLNYSNKTFCSLKKQKKTKNEEDLKHTIALWRMNDFRYILTDVYFFALYVVYLFSKVRLWRLQFLLFKKNVLFEKNLHFFTHHYFVKDSFLFSFFFFFLWRILSEI